MQKTRSSRRKATWWSAKTESRISTIQKAIYLFITTSALFGFLINCFYLVPLSILPQDVSLNDSFMLLVVCFTFGFVFLFFLVWSVGGWLYSAPFIHRLTCRYSSRKMELTEFGRTVPKTVSSVLFVSLLLNWVSLLFSPNEVDQEVGRMLGAFQALAFFIMTALCFRWPSVPQSRPGKLAVHEKAIVPPQETRSAIFIFIIIVFLLLCTNQTLSRASMSKVGMRAEHVALRLDQENLQRLELAYRALGRDLVPCVTEIKPGETATAALIQPAELLWHGIGSTTFVRFFPAGPDKTALVLELEREGLAVVRTSPGVEYSCPTAG